MSRAGNSKPSGAFWGKGHEASLLNSDISHNEELISRVEAQIQEASSSADSIDGIEKRRALILKKSREAEDQNALAACEQELLSLQEEAGKYLTEGEALSGEIAR